MSSLYESLCHSLAEEQDLLALAANARSGQPAPNLFMAAVHWLLTKGAQHTVTEYYPDISPEMTTHGDPYPIFRSFCLEHGDEIVDLISTRLVQTNVVRRCAVLLPAFAVAMGRDAGQPLSLVEIGASAGFCSGTGIPIPIATGGAGATLIPRSNCHQLSGEACALGCPDPSPRLSFELVWTLTRWIFVTRMR